MNISNYFKSKSYGRRLFSLLMALFLVSGLVVNQAPQAVVAWGDIDPDDPDGIVDPINPPTFTPPADGFTWAMANRYGPDGNGDGMIDTFWSRELMQYDDNYIFPDHWKVYFNGCQAQEDFDHPLNTPNLYTWEVVEVEGLVANVHRCRGVSLDFPAQGTYTVRLTVHDPSGNIVPAGKTNPEYFQQPVVIRDILIATLGDSYGSGEGNPDIPQKYHAKDWPSPGWDLDAPAVWQDERCHRSANSGPSLAAIAIENSDPHTSVTFISFACSGATINRLAWDLGLWFAPLGSGMLGHYWGAVNVGIPYSQTYENYIPPQMVRLEEAMIPPAGKPARQIDALIVSGGGNDMHFGDILLSCFDDDDCWADDFTIHDDPYNPADYTLENIIQRDLGHWGASGPVNTLPGSFSQLHDRINALYPLKPAHVYLTQYPDQTRADDGSFCDLMTDVFVPNVLDKKISRLEAQEAVNRALGPLNDHIREVAQGYVDDGWQFVDGLSVYDVDPEVPAGTPGLFVTGHDGKGHGYCASNNWIRRADESEIIQGPVNFRYQTRGTLHPTYRGHEVFKERLLRYMLPDLVPQLPQNPPQFTFSFSSGDHSDLISADTGWYLKSCTSDHQCQRKVVAQAVARSSVNLAGALVSANGVDGCAIEGVSCEIPNSDNPKEVTFNVEITASGIYQFRFIAQDSSGQAASLEQEIRVDLDAPVLATPVGPFEVEEGGSVALMASASSPGENVFDYDWDLDNDGVFETTEEQPIFSAANLDGPTTRTVQVKVTDRAGWIDTERAAVNVLNTAPAIVYDNFDDNVTNPSLWIVVQQGGPTAAETNQRLEITLPANSSGTKFDAAYHSACQLRGDFDIRVDYELRTWPPANGVRLSLNTSQGNIERASFAPTGDFAGGPEVYLTDFSGNVVGITATSDRSGKLRLARVGDTLTGFYFGNGGWITVGSYQTNSEDVPFALGSWSHDPIFADQEVKLAFDNMMIKKGELVCPPSDATSPTISLTTPAEEAVYLLGQTVNADYACQDEAGGSGLASCVGNVPNGSPIDTSSISLKTFTVDAADNAGNTDSVTRTYRVIYNVTSFTAPVDNPPVMNIAKAGQAIPLKWRLTDANGSPVTNLTGVTVTAVSLSCSSVSSTDAIEEYATSNSGLQNLGDGYYQWNWKSPTSYANTCKTLKLDLGEGAGNEHLALFQFKK